MVLKHHFSLKILCITDFFVNNYTNFTYITDFSLLTLFVFRICTDNIYKEGDDKILDQQYIEMGNRIKIRRKELKLKQSELAENLDISNNHMSSIETGKQKPSMDIFIKLCDELKVTPDYLLLGSMHASNIPQDISDKLRLCNQADVELAKDFVELLVERNKTSWNNNNYI